MKTLKQTNSTITFFLTWIFMLLIIVSCSNDNQIVEEKPLSYDEIIELLKEDEGFQNYFKESMEFQLSFSNSFLSAIENGDVSLKEMPTDLIQLTSLISMSESETYDYLNKGAIFVENLTLKYPSLLLLKENEISAIINNALSVKSYENYYNDSSFFYNRNSCQSAYEGAFRRIHAEYDQGVINCVIVGIATLGAGLIPCNATNVYGTFYKLAVAADQYNQCMGN